MKESYNNISENLDMGAGSETLPDSEKSREIVPFYRNCYALFNKFPENQSGALYRAFFEFAFDGNLSACLSEITFSSESVFSFLASLLDKQAKSASIPFFRNCYNLLKTFPDDVSGKFYRKFFEFAFDGTENEKLPENGNYQEIWEILRSGLAKRRAHQKAGRGGGRPRGGVWEFSESEEKTKPETKFSNLINKGQVNKGQVNKGQIEFSLSQVAPAARKRRMRVLEFLDKLNSVYPAHRRGYKLTAGLQKTVESVLDREREIFESLEIWKASSEWQEDGGKFVPSFGKFLLEKRFNSTPAAGRGKLAQDLNEDREKQIERSLAARKGAA